MHFQNTKTKKIKQKRLKEDELNTKLISKPWASGKVVHYNEKSILNGLNIGSIRRLLDDLLSFIVDDIKRYETLDCFMKSHPVKSSVKVMETLIHNYDTNNFVYRNVLRKKITISEAYHLVIRESLDKLSDHDLKGAAKKKTLKAIEYIKLIDLRIQSHIRRILLEKIQEDMYYNFILVIDQFMPEVFFDPSDRLQGIIYRENNQQIKFNHFAIHYQKPIVKYQGELKQGEHVLIDLEQKTVEVNPSKTSIDTLKKRYWEQKGKSYFMNPYVGSKYKVHAMISNYRDVIVTRRTPLFNQGLVYYTDAVMAAKGSPLTEEEWKKRLSYIFKHFKGDEVIVRLPGFDSYFDVADLGSKRTNRDTLEKYPDYYENLTSALSSISQDYPNKRITISVPYVQFQVEYETWKSHMNDALHVYNNKNNIEFSFECDDEIAMHEMDFLHNIDSFVINLDNLCQRYIPNFILSREFVTREMIYGHNIYADLQYTKLIYRPKDKQRIILQGLTLQTNSVFRRLLIAGYDEFVIPVHSLLDFAGVIEKKAHGKGKYIGVYHSDRERTLFYRELKKRSNQPPGAKRPYGLYQKVKKHLKRKEEEKKKNNNSNNDENE